MTNPANVLIIQVSGLAKQIATGEGLLTILHPLDFEVAQGQSIAILGPSGSGKSTLLGLLAGLDLPSAGKVLINGTDIFSLDEDARAVLRRQRVGFVFQSFQLLPSMTALENVMLPLEISDDEDSRDKAIQALSEVGLSNRLNHYPLQLSGGEQQRVALARAYVAQPQLLLADEPTGNLDAQTGEQIIDLLFALNQEHGSTLILVTHDESLARRCQRKFNLVAGRLDTQ